MIAVTEAARKMLNEYLKNNDISSPLRIIPMQGACSGVSLGLALDETKAEDMVCYFDGLTISMDKQLLTLCGFVTVDYIESVQRPSFSITTSHPVPGSVVGCASSNGSCRSGGCSC